MGSCGVDLKWNESILLYPAPYAKTVYSASFKRCQTKLRV